jgi:endoglucanase
MEEMKLLEKLISSLGVSGSEMKVRDIIINEIKPYVDEIYVDKLGNLITRKKGTKPKVMLASHMDEIGLMIKVIDENGKIYCSMVGHTEPIYLLGQRVDIQTRDDIIHGITTTVEMSADKPIKELPGPRELVVDTGLSKKELERMGVDRASYLSLGQEACYLGSKDIISGKALDDRIGCFILIELAKRLKKVKNEMYFVFTVQEELGLYGAITSAYKIEPEWAVVVDVTNANDFSDRPTKILGNGPCITVKEMEMMTNKCINDWLLKIAKKNNIPIQVEVSDYAITEALAISISKGGVPTALVNVPIRNPHSTVEVAHKKDIENAILLLEKLLTNPPIKCLY